MGHRYQAVGWNRQKKIYDVFVVSGIVVYLGVFVGIGLALRPNAGILRESRVEAPHEHAFWRG